ncbi:MAG: thiamine pyrophosphate-dependent enzyme, partial [Kiloniellales bacterium]
AAALTGPLEASADRLRGANQGSEWQAAEIAELRQALRARLVVAAAGGHGPQAVVEATQAAAPPDCRATVDSGAHMLSAMAFWQAERPFDVLKSNGLSTMGFALPAAIAAALHEPARPVVAFTGDAGLMMCLSELATAVRHGCRLVVIAFNDAALSMIDIKQQRQGRASRGVRYPAVDLAAAARALGCRGWRVDPDTQLAPILDQAFAADRPALVDIAIDPSGYAAQLAALRD